MFNKQMRIPPNSSHSTSPQRCHLYALTVLWDSSKVIRPKMPSFIFWRWLGASTLIPQHRFPSFHWVSCLHTCKSQCHTSKVLPSLPQIKKSQLKSHCLYNNIDLLMNTTGISSLSSTVNTFYLPRTTNCWKHLLFWVVFTLFFNAKVIIIQPDRRHPYTIYDKRYPYIIYDNSNFQFVTATWNDFWTIQNKVSNTKMLKHPLLSKGSHSLTYQGRQYGNYSL